MKRVCRLGARVLAAIVVVIVTVVPGPRPARAATTVRFGIDEGHAAPDLFKQSGASWDRINFHWDAFQPSGPDDWQAQGNVPDADVAGDLAAGIAVVGVVTNPPAWATRNGSVPANLSLPLDDPRNYWASFVHHLAAQYAGRIDDWIIWNEPDFDPQHFSRSSWGGTEDEFYILTKTADLAAKSANPNAKIIFAGTTYWSDVLLNRKLFLDRVLDRATQIDPAGAANGYYFDAVDIHIYSSPYQLISTPKAYRDVLASYGLTKPIWVSEMNVVPWNDPASTVPRGGYRATLDEQAAYVIQAIALARVAGLERAAIYKMIDGEIIQGEPYGLVRNDLSQRPAYRAFQVAMQYLNDPNATVTYDTPGNVDVVTLVDGKRRVVVAWSGKATANDLPVTPQGTSAQVVTKLGQSTAVPLPTDPNQMSDVLHLPPATANTNDGNLADYIVGGDPTIFVEDGVGDGVMLGPSTLYYPITGFAISGAFLDYFQHRGALRTFGYPISRPFLFLGSQVQFFQRRVLQLQPNNTVGQLNLLDPDYMPYTEINNATFPAPDLTLTHSLPNPGTTDYVSRIFQYIQATTPDQWNGIPVKFDQTFTTTVTLADAFPPGKGQATLLPGINLELWGVPTSQPAIDPNNHNFVYQRFQRGIMHYDKTTGATQGLLLGQYFADVITGWNVPSDLDAAARASRFYRQYTATQPHWIARPADLPNTDLTFAFQRQPATPPPGASPAGVTQPATGMPAATPSLTTTPLAPTPTATPPAATPTTAPSVAVSPTATPVAASPTATPAAPSPTATPAIVPSPTTAPTATKTA